LTATTVDAQLSRLPAPRDLTATPVSVSQINLAWSEISTDEAGFRVERAAGSSGPWSQLARLGANVTNFSHTGLAAGTTVFYRVRAFRGRSVSAPSNVASATTQSGGGGIAGPVGYIGASVTVYAIDGHRQVGGTSLWPSVGPDYGGGSISRWATDGNQYWNTFDELRAQFPQTKTIWWELVTQNQNSADNFDNALRVLALLRQRMPDAVIYVSAQEDYTDGHVCPNSGADGPARMQAVADQLVAGGHALPGPIMGPLRPDEMETDCHPNTAGQAVLGNQLRDFFD
jgi:hypothetical protein